MSACEHIFQFQGVVYYNGPQISGSSARARFYADRYYCSKCLEVVDKNECEVGNTYQKPIERSFPGAPPKLMEGLRYCKIIS